MSDGALPLSFDEVITTTRSVRRRFDFDRPIDLAVVRECLGLAVQAPTGSNAQSWHFVVVQDETTRAALADIYRQGFAAYRERQDSVFAQDGEATPGGAPRIGRSVEHLAENLHRAPVLVIPCIEGRVDGPAPGFMASIIPATWSFMLACRSRGLGTCWTTMHLVDEPAAAEVLGIPYDSVTQVALIPVGHTTPGGFRPAKRQELDSVVHLDKW